MYVVSLSKVPCENERDRERNALERTRRRLASFPLRHQLFRFPPFIFKEPEHPFIFKPHPCLPLPIKPLGLAHVDAGRLLWEGGTDDNEQPRRDREDGYDEESTTLVSWKSRVEGWVRGGVEGPPGGSEGRGWTTKNCRFRR